jgi:hypothetical protein
VFSHIVPIFYFTWLQLPCGATSLWSSLQACVNNHGILIAYLQFASKIGSSFSLFAMWCAYFCQQHPASFDGSTSFCLLRSFLNQLPSGVHIFACLQHPAFLDGPAMFCLLYFKVISHLMAACQNMCLCATPCLFWMGRQVFVCCRVVNCASFRNLLLSNTCLK